MKKWHVGLNRGGPMCGGVQPLVGCGANVVRLGMFGVLIWFGVAEGTQRWQGYRIRFWVLVRR